MLGAGLIASGVAGCASDVTTPRDAEYVASLTSANERPARSSGASGQAIVRVAGDVASYSVTAAALDGAPTVAHLLIGGPETVAGQVIVRLALTGTAGTSAPGGIASGTIDLGNAITFNNTTISGDSLRTLLENGATYVNVYTTAYPGGEIRGQLERQR